MVFMDSSWGSFPQVLVEIASWKEVGGLLVLVIQGGQTFQDTAFKNERVILYVLWTCHPRWADLRAPAWDDWFEKECHRFWGLQHHAQLGIISRIWTTSAPKRSQYHNCIVLRPESSRSPEQWPEESWKPPSFIGWAGQTSHDFTGNQSQTEGDWSFQNLWTHRHKRLSV